MRDIERIEPFCNELAEIWKKSFPDWRFGQLMYNFLGWIITEKKNDIFFPEENEMISMFREYANETSMWHRDWK